MLTERDISIALLEVTATGLAKGIMDATAPFREFVRAQSIHNYATQPKGQDSKRLVVTRLLCWDGEFEDRVTSLYRPQTKDGDPRVWVYGLSRQAKAGDVLAFVRRDNILYVLNVTQHDLSGLGRVNEEFAELIRVLAAKKISIVDELLSSLRVIAQKGFLHAGAGADTTVGMLLERELGIAPNSRREPDYHGIEIKASRSGRGNRHNLFAKVPDWYRSPIGSSRKLLDTFGYTRDGRCQLYCTVSSRSFNSQGLRLEVREAGRDLWEVSELRSWPDVAVWSLDSLENALLEKHAETFWVEAESRRSGGIEEIRFVSVRHTARPIVQQVGPLIHEGNVTVDHLVREVRGVAAERGPLFKLRHGTLGLLFPPARTYNLLE